MRSVGSTESPRSEGAGFAGAEAGKIAALAYSGGLDTTCAIAWLKEDYGFDEVVAVMVDVGQEFDVEASLARGKAAGAADVLLVDRKAAFAGDQCAKAIQANALYENRYPLVSALSRPVVAQAVAEIAQEVGAEAVVHGCTGKGNDQLRFELAFKANFPGVRVIAPLRDTIWTRDAEIAYAEARGIPVRHSQASPYSTDENLFGRSIEAGSLEDPWVAPPEDIYELTKDPATAPAPSELVVSFEQGVPVAVDGVALELPDLILQLNEQVGAYGVGRLDMIENRVVGIKSREIYEAPAALALIEAHKALEDLVLTKDELRIKRGLEVKWTELVYEGLWFSPARAAIDAFVATTQQRVTGDVRLALSASSAIVAGRRSEFALYSEQLASYSTGETFPHQAAEGFITLQALEVELVAQLARGKAVV
jgi:argininosuccinate synthase